MDTKIMELYTCQRFRKIVSWLSVQLRGMGNNYFLFFYVIHLLRKDTIHNTHFVNMELFPYVAGSYLTHTLRKITVCA